ncbi:MAG: hypothetical protein HC804_06895 [Anaerolineae bacterium]|nr:hypothetical protein [Anaerolineae bacterium]
MINTYEIGDRVRISTATPFQSTAGVAFDPDVVTFEVKEPGQDTVAYVYGTDDNVTKLATGDYACDVDVDTPGTWYYHITGEADDGENSGADQGYFSVLRKVV